VVFSALIKTIYARGIPFRISFFPDGVPLSRLTDRAKKQIIELWKVWQVYSLVDPEDIEQVFKPVDTKSINRLQSDLNYYPQRFEIYTRNGVTPFASLEYIANYDEREVQNRIQPLYKLNQITSKILREKYCDHPFVSRALSVIITAELYLNFLDHAKVGSISTESSRMAFMGISIHNCTDDQGLLKLNFDTECVPESKNFYFNNITKKYNNQPYICFTFLDFGLGVVETLKEKYQNKFGIDGDGDSILEYAFDLDSSQHLSGIQLDEENFFTRGLFDVVSIVKRYKGMLIARSNRGKILYDFSSSKSISDGKKSFGDKTLDFPGTLISIYLPAIENSNDIQLSAIKPEIDYRFIGDSNIKYLNFKTVIKNVRMNKEYLYQDLMKGLEREVFATNEDTIIYLSFKGTESVDSRLIRKTINILLTDHRINHSRNVIIIHPPELAIIEDIKERIGGLDEAIRNFKIHPLPIVEYNDEKKDVEIRWLGISEPEDANRLSQLLLEGVILGKDEFSRPYEVISHLSDFDGYGNLMSNFPKYDQILKVFQIDYATTYSQEIAQLLERKHCVREKNLNEIFLCSGNYYQHEYVDLTNVVNDKHECHYVAGLLFNLLERAQELNVDSAEFIAVSTKSHKILKSLVDANYLKSVQCHYLEEDLLKREADITFEVGENKRYILICDVISTGFAAKKIDDLISNSGSILVGIGVIVSTLNEDSPNSLKLADTISHKVYNLHTHPIRKYLRSELAHELQNKTLTRVNPHTHLPITLSIRDTGYDDSVLFRSNVKIHPETRRIDIENEFLDLVPDAAINLGYLSFNNVIHPYFFNTRLILNSFDKPVLKVIFDLMNNENLKKDRVTVFYPRRSGIDSLKRELLKEVLNNHAIEEIEMERFSIPAGWKFPHNADYLFDKVKGSVCLVLDDGSCSGDSIIQMIDEIAFYEPIEIISLCFIGRLDDHKREFFSRLSKIRVGGQKDVPLYSYFGSHWHIPTYYVDQNPTSKEQLWIKTLMNIKNIPKRIKDIAENVLSSIQPIPEKAFKDYKFLPKIQDKDRTIPKKEILKMRDEVGKVIGFRLYRESFDFFNAFANKYSVKPKIGDVAAKYRNREIELLCAVFIYEPYLYSYMKRIVPDVAEHVCEFSRVLLFDYDRISPNLSYLWDKRDIVHLFFITHENEDLIGYLRGEYFEKLLTFGGGDTRVLNYTLYRFLRYFPLTDEGVSHGRFSGDLRISIGEWLEQKETMHKQALRSFYHFILSLPRSEEFEVQLLDLKDSFDRQKEFSKHEERTSFNHNVAEVIARLRDCCEYIRKGDEISSGIVFTVKDRWMSMMEFISPILSFNRRFDDFLAAYPYLTILNKMEATGNSFRGLVGYADEVVLSLTTGYKDIEKLNNTISTLDKIQTHLTEGLYVDLICNPMSNLKEILDKLIFSIESMGFICICDIDTSKFDVSILIPKLYSDKLIVDEVVNNIVVNAESKEPVNLKIVGVRSNEVSFMLTNRKRPGENGSGTGEGTKCLINLSDFDHVPFSYFRTEDSFEYNQTFTFKTKTL
jgi:hypothetical protein